MSQVLLDEAGVELTAPTCTTCEDTAEKVKNFEELIESRGQQVRGIHYHHGDVERNTLSPW